MEDVLHPILYRVPCLPSPSTASLPHPLHYDLDFFIATDKALVFIQKMLISFLFLDENIHCGYPLEAPRRGASNEYPQHMFSSRNKKNIMWIPYLICRYVVFFLISLTSANSGELSCLVTGLVVTSFLLSCTPSSFEKGFISEENNLQILSFQNIPLFRRKAKPVLIEVASPESLSVPLKDGICCI